MKNDCVSRQGIVQAIEGQNITVLLTVKSACAACHAKGMCGTSEESDRSVLAQNVNHEKFEVGERVQVIMKEELANQAVLLAYLFPLLILIATFIVMGLCCTNDLINVLAALSATALYFLILWKFKKKLNKKFVFTVTKIYNI